MVAFFVGYWFHGVVEEEEVRRAKVSEAMVVEPAIAEPVHESGAAESEAAILEQPDDDMFVQPGTKGFTMRTKCLWCPKWVQVERRTAY